MMIVQLQQYLAMAILLASSSLAFVPRMDPSHMTSTSSHNVAIDPRLVALEDEEKCLLTNNAIDISKILSEVESALQFASESFPNSQTLRNEVASVADLVQDDQLGVSPMRHEEVNSSDSYDIVATKKKDEHLVATAIAGSALGVVAGSPLVLGAALGMAGSKLLDDSEEGRRNRKMLEKLGQQITSQVQGAVEFAQAELLEEAEDPDLAKVSQKLVALVQSRADAWQLDVQNKATSWKEGAKVAPSILVEAVKQTMESEEFQEELKHAPGRAFRAVKGFVESDEVKTASGSLWKAFKATIESDEMKALQSRASQALKETIESKTRVD